MFTGHNCINKFIKWIFVQQEKINHMIKEHFNKKVTMTIDDEKKINDSEIFGYAKIRWNKSNRSLSYNK